MLHPIFVPQGRSRTRYKTGYIDTSGKVVIPATFEHGTQFSSGLACVQVKGGRWGVINEHGEFSIEPRLWNWCEFNEGVAAIASRTGKWGVINPHGEFVVEPRYDYIGPLRCGLAVVRIGQPSAGRCGYISRTGAETIPPVFHGAKDFSEELAAVRVGQLWGYTDTFGSLKIKPQFTATGRAKRWPDIRAEQFISGLAPVWESTDLYRYINTDGVRMFHSSFDEANKFSERRAAVRIGSRFGYIDDTGEIVVPCRFTLVRDFSCGLAKVEMELSRPNHPSQCGFIDRSGNLVIAATYSSAENFWCGLSLATTDDHLRYIDTSGTAVWEGKYVEYGVLF